MRAREPRQEFLLRSDSVGFARRHLVGRACAENAEILGQQHQPRPLGHGGGNQRLGLRQVLGDTPPDTIWTAATRNRGTSALRSFAAAIVAAYLVAGATGAGALAVDASPPRETMGSDQLPVTRYS